ncbi:MAG: ribosomal protein S18-alanine N-acetyltransferase [Ruminiclostridium sp.]
MNEIEAITKLERLCFESCWDSAAITAQMNSPCCISVLWQEAGEPVGYALGNIVCDEAELYRIAVVPTNRKTGTGTKILQRFIADCKKRGAKKVFLEVRSRNTAAIGLYEKLGFSRLAIRKGYYGDDDAIIYSLENF